MLWFIPNVPWRLHWVRRALLCAEHHTAYNLLACALCVQPARLRGI